MVRCSRFLWLKSHVPINFWFSAKTEASRLNLYVWVQTLLPLVFNHLKVLFYLIESPVSLLKSTWRQAHRWVSASTATPSVARRTPRTVRAGVGKHLLSRARIYGSIPIDTITIHLYIIMYIYRYHYHYHPFTSYFDVHHRHGHDVNKEEKTIYEATWKVTIFLVGQSHIICKCSIFHSCSCVE